LPFALESVFNKEKSGWRQETKGFCKFCGRALNGGDIVAWRYFGVICGNCFLPYAKYVLENIEELEAVTKAIENAPGMCGEA